MLNWIAVVDLWHRLFEVQKQQRKIARVYTKNNISLKIGFHLV